MLSLVHFSRVFPYIHPYLFPVESAKQAGSAAVAETLPASQAAVAAVFPALTAEVVAAAAGTDKGRRLKSLYRRHLRSQRSDALTYSGALRHVAG